MPLHSMRGIQPHLQLFLRDIPMDHIVRGTQMLDQPVYYRYFKGYRIQKLGLKKIVELVEREIIEKENEKLAELFVALWNRANGALYHEMLLHVKKINEDVEAIERIEDEDAARISEIMLEEYDKERLFICVVINQVRFAPQFVLETFGYPLPVRPAAEPGPESGPEGPPTEEPEA
ncbi:MAG: hypothetical protein ABIK09_01240 [Pseudomonadota bacterium]